MKVPYTYMAKTKIIGVEGLSADLIRFEVQRGGRFVLFQYCVSVIFVTFKRPSPVYFIRAGENPLGKGMGFTLLTLVAGWWGFPWGPIYSVQSIYNNLSGGKDVTKDIVATLSSPTKPAATRPATAAKPLEKTLV
jgi:hypothetical protein